jgi:hypothetical protein
LTGLQRQRIVSLSLEERLMMRISTFMTLVFGAGMLANLGVSTLSARPLTPAEKRYVHPYHGLLPVCEDPAVLQRIFTRFQNSDHKYWSSGLRIIAYEGVRETGYRSTGLDYIPRRYCDAALHMSDGRTRHLKYWVGENLGIIGWGWGVEWCIVGLDRNLAFGGSCSTAEP